MRGRDFVQFRSLNYSLPPSLFNRANLDVTQNELSSLQQTNIGYFGFKQTDAIEGNFQILLQPILKKPHFVQ